MVVCDIFPFTVLISAEIAFDIRRIVGIIRIKVDNSFSCGQCSTVVEHRIIHDFQNSRIVFLGSLHAPRLGSIFVFGHAD